MNLKSPQNKPDVVRQAALVDTEGRPGVVREVASFSLFRRADPRLITSWGFFEVAGFNTSVPTPGPGDARPVGIAEALDDAEHPHGGVGSNLSILDTLLPKTEKVYMLRGPGPSRSTPPASASTWVRTR